MFTLKSFIFIIMICVGKSEVDFATMCKNNYTDLNNTQIDVSKYCSDKLCIEKCCSEDEIFHVDYTCTNKINLFKQIANVDLSKALESQVNYSSKILSSRGGDQLGKDFVLLRNHRSVANCTHAHNLYDDYNIFQDGSLQRRDNTSKKMYTIDRLKYCIDYTLYMEETGDDTKLLVKILIRQFAGDPKDVEKIQNLEEAALLISSFFLLLVLVVYCLLPDLQNLIGQVLMAYITTLLATFILKLVVDFVIKNPPPGFCKIISPCLYFTAISCIFWLNVMSYDVFWALRGHRKMREINRRGERVKFMWYCLYAWGAPLLITAIVTILDNVDLSNSNIEIPFFYKCMDSGETRSILAYYKIPIGILIVTNIILFFVTVYNIWMVKRAVGKCDDSRSSKSQSNRISTFIKLSVLMGVSWCSELLPTQRTMLKYILTDLYNLLTGMTIFILFVCNKNVLNKLCNKFTILKNFRTKLESFQHSRSGTTRSTVISRGSTVKKSFENQNPELDLLKNGPKQDNIVV